MGRIRYMTADMFYEPFILFFQGVSGKFGWYGPVLDDLSTNTDFDNYIVTSENIIGCGRVNIDLNYIIGGQNTAFGNHPWQAALLFREPQQ